MKNSLVGFGVATKALAHGSKFFLGHLTPNNERFGCGEQLLQQMLWHSDFAIVKVGKEGTHGYWGFVRTIHLRIARHPIIGNKITHIFRHSIFDYITYLVHDCHSILSHCNNIPLVGSLYYSKEKFGRPITPMLKLKSPFYRGNFNSSSMADYVSLGGTRFTQVWPAQSPLR